MTIIAKGYAVVGALLLASAAGCVRSPQPAPNLDTGLDTGSEQAAVEVSAMVSGQAVGSAPAASAALLPGQYCFDTLTTTDAATIDGALLLTVESEGAVTGYVVADVIEFASGYEYTYRDDLVGQMVGNQLNLTLTSYPEETLEQTAAVWQVEGDRISDGTQLFSPQPCYELHEKLLWGTVEPGDD